jgi:tetratricopeptide (TPR) repeat protein
MIALMVMVVSNAHKDFGLVALMVVVFGVGAFFAWLTVRAWREREVNPAIVDTHGMVGTFSQEVLQKIDRKKMERLVPSLSTFQRLLAEEKLEEAGVFLDTLSKDGADPFWLELAKAQWLGKCGRHLEAADHFRALALKGSLSPESQTVLLGEELTERVIGGQAEEAKRRCEELVVGNASTAEKIFVLDQLASLPVYRGLTTYLDEADRWSREALSLAPESLTLQGTRGGILVERGRFEEALPLLKNVVRKSHAPIDHFTSYFYLGLIAKHHGDLKAMRKHAMRAWNYCTMPSFRERLARELVDFSPRKRQWCSLRARTQQP